MKKYYFFLISLLFLSLSSKGSINNYNKNHNIFAPASTDCVPISEFPYLQNFDNWTISNPGDTCTADGSVPLEECWENVTGDDSDWDIYSGATPTADTGPSDDLLGGGNYIYMEASGCTEKTASILTPHFDFTNVTNPYLTFYMYMYGSDMGSLDVYYTTDNGSTWEELESFSGDYGEFWFKININLVSLAGESDVQFKFTVTTGDGELSDIAIDNFIVKDYLPYCDSSGRSWTWSEEAINQVIFNDINNDSGVKKGGYKDFTNLGTLFYRGESNDLTVYVHTADDGTVYTKAWIDWNQDHDFDDEGEEYDLGTAYDVDDDITSKSPLEITVPNDAKIGKTRMRISTKADEYPTSCEWKFYGEVEDYTIVVANKCDDYAVWTGVKWINKVGASLDESDLSDKFLIVDEVYLTDTKSFEGCALSVSTSNSLTINAGDYIDLVNNIYNDGKIVIENTGSLIQTDDDAIVEGAGKYEMQIQSQQMNNYYDYGFWSSPIESFTLGGVVPDAWGYYAFDASIQNWEAKDALTLMVPGLSYAISAPSDFEGGTIDANFKQDDAKFNAGNISVPLTINGTGAQDDDDANLVGNPYPSPIDFVQLADDNPNIQGAYYVWTNCAGLDDDGNHQMSGFAIYSTGSGSTAACDGNGVTIDQYIASGQGFYVEANDSGDLVFKNSQRVTASNIFINRTEGLDRLWLDLSDASSFSQTLIGFFDEATDQLDRLYDAHLLDNESFSLYSLSGNEKLAIQGLSLWTGEDREIPLGFTVTADGSHTISLHQVEGVFQEDVNVYLKDLYMGNTIDLKEGAYDFTAEQGTYNDRFVLVFTTRALQVDEVENLLHVNVLSNNGMFMAVSDQNNINQVEIYDLTGKLLKLYQTQQPENKVEMNLKSLPPQVLIFKIILTDQNSMVIKSIR